MQVGHSRRSFLMLAAAGAFVRPAAASSLSGPGLQALGRWKTGNSTISPLAVNDGRIHFCGNKTFGSIDPAKASILWEKPLEADSPAVFKPRLGGGKLLISSQKGITAYSPESGERIWHYAARTQTGVPLLGPASVYAGDGHEIIALDLASGKERWRHAGVPDTLANYAPALAGDRILAGPGDGRLYALSEAEGALLWETDRRVEWQYLRQIYVSGDILVAGSYKEKLFGIDVKDGRKLWEFNAGNFINSHHVAGETAYLWSPTGWVYAINAKTGSVRWRHQTTDYDETESNWASLMAELVTHDGRLLALDMADTLHLLDMKDGSETGRYSVGDPVRHAVLPVSGQGLAFPLMSAEVLLTNVP